MGGCETRHLMVLRLGGVDMAMVQIGQVMMGVGQLSMLMNV